MAESELNASETKTINKSLKLHLSLQKGNPELQGVKLVRYPEDTQQLRSLNDGARTSLFRLTNSLARQEGASELGMRALLNLTKMIDDDKQQPAAAAAQETVDLTRMIDDDKQIPVAQRPAAAAAAAAAAAEERRQRANKMWSWFRNNDMQPTTHIEGQEDINWAERFARVKKMSKKEFVEDEDAISLVEGLFMLYNHGFEGMYRRPQS